MKINNLTIIKEAYLDYNTTHGAHYRALAVDPHGTQYVVIWTDINLDCSDECDAANWDQPDAIVLAMTGVDMKITLHYNFTGSDGCYCERIKECSINRLATPRDTKDEALRTIYKMLPVGASWRMVAMENGKVTLTAWGVGHSLDGYTW